MKKKNRNRIILLLIATIVVIAVFALFNNLKQAAQKRIVSESTVVKVEKGDLILYSLAKGKIASASVTDVTFTGSIKNIYVKIGDTVAKDVVIGQYTSLTQRTVDLTASVAGVITAIPSAVKNTFSIADPNQLQMNVEISEKDIAKISVAQNAVIYVDAINVNINGSVTAISQVGNTSADYTTYTVTVTFSKGDNKIFLGMTGSAKVETTTKKDVYKVPIEALIEANGKYYILNKTWFSNMNKPKTDYYIEVTVGSADVNFAEISGTQLDNLEVVVLPTSTTLSFFNRPSSATSN